MSLVALSDVQIDEFLACPKRVENPGSKSRIDGKHVRRDFRVSSDDGRHEFILFTRQSALISESYSAGLRWKAKTGEEVILLRCNGSDHAHRNAVERQEFTAQSHVHRATEKYILAGRKAKSFARPFHSLGRTRT